MMDEVAYKSIENLIMIAERLRDAVDDHQHEIKTAYRRFCFSHDSVDYEEQYSITRENELPSTIKNLMTTVIRDLNQLKSFTFNNSGILTRRLEDLIQDYLNSLQIMFQEHTDIISWYDVNNYMDWTDEFRAITLLTQFANIEKNIILVGSNGSGKSMLAQILKGNDYERITVIPAQKSMFFTSDSSILSARVSDVKDKMLSNTIEFSKSETDYGFNEFQQYHFTKMLIAMREDYFNYLHNCCEEGLKADPNQCIYGKVRSVIKTVFKDIDIVFGDSFDELIYCRRDNNKYPLNGLSEGEKVALYYSMGVLMAPKDSYVVIDEPETFLNPSLANTVWDVLTRERSDCQFIFITHSVDFTLARHSSQIIWIKKYIYPDTFEFEQVNDSFMLPKALMTEILGSKKPVLFCEGDDKASIDYRVYSGLFYDKYTVIPVGGHKEVQNYCKVLNNAEWIGIEAKGLVDGDLRDDDSIAKLNSQKITVLPFNEVEMLLLEENVLEATLKGAHPSEYERIIRDFKSEFWDTFSKQKERVAINILKTKINSYLESEKMNKCNNIVDIKKNLQSILDINVDKLQSEIMSKLDRIISSKDYNQLLNVCNLKQEITRGLANIKLDSNYEEKAIEHILTDKELQSLLMEKYFAGITSN